MNGLSYDTYTLTMKEKRDCAIISGVCLFIVSYIFYRSALVSALSVLAVPVCARQYAIALGERRRELLLTQFRDFLYSLSASFAAGRQMRDGLAEARDNLRLMYDDKSPMLREISGMLVKLDESRASEEEVLRDFAGRSSIMDVRSFFDTYFICRMTGGDVNSAISKTSEMLIEKIGVEREIKAITSQKRFEGKIISVMPVAVILLLNVASPEYIEVLYTTATGRVIMTAALAGIAYSYHAIMKLTRIEV